MTAEPRPWTPAQREAIELRGTNLLVSAGAGAGKTAVLVERVVRRLVDPHRPVDADRLLVVTFTEAAAAELRERVARALERAAAERPEDARLRRQLALLGRAAISTIHSFCLSLVRQHFYLLPVDPSLRVLGEAEARLLEAEVLDELLESRYAAGDPAFLDLVDRYGGRTDEALRQAVLRLHRLARSLPRPEAWLEALAARFDLPGDTLADTPWFPALVARCRRMLARVALELEDALELARGPGGDAAYAARLAAELAAVQEAADRPLPDWPALREAVAAAEAAFGRLPTARGPGSDREVRERVQRLRRGALRALRALGAELARPEAELLAELRALGAPVRALVALVRDFERAYGQAKAARGAVDFADLEHLALRLLADPADPEGLRPSEVARQVRARFEEVLVDEYQDTSPVQDAILRLVARDGGEEGPPNLVLVGDAKQSIYGFRLAEPGLFLDRYRQYPPAGGGPGRRVDLAHNFRSRRPVLDAVNFLFRQLLAPDLGGLAYGREAELVYGADYPPPAEGDAGAGDAPVEVHVLERPAEGDGEAPDEEEADAGDPTAAEREARLAAELIAAWVRGGEGKPPLRVWDPALGTYRPARYGDVAVLLRAPRHRADAFVRTLAARGIPVRAEAGGGYLGALEVRLLVALLQVIDNPRQDIPLAAVLRSPLVGLTDEQLARIRLACPQGDFYTAARVAAAREGGALGEAAAAGECGGTAPGEARGAAAGEVLSPATGLPPEAVERLRAFFARLEAWRTAARRQPLSALLERIFRETGFPDFVAALPGGEQRRAHLQALHDRARRFDRFSRQGLFRFLRLLERLEDVGEDLEPPPVLAPGEDAVRVLSIHRSKGLEFPCVIVADLGRPWSRRDLEGDLLCHRELGLGPRVVDLERRVRYPSLAHRAVAERLREDGLAEELRLLYVALTRARERLVLIGSVRDLPTRLARWSRAARLQGWPLPRGLRAGAACALDWIGPALARHADGAPLRPGAGEPADPAVAGDPSRWRVRLWRAADLAALDPADGEVEPGAGGEEAPAVVPGPEPAATGAQEAAAAAAGAGEGAAPPEAGGVPGRQDPAGGGPGGQDPLADLARRLAWSYPYRALCHRFAKRAVSDLKGRLDPARLDEPLPSDLRVRVPRWPRFARPAGAEASPAERGAATHRLLQYLDLSRPLDLAGIRRQAEELVARELLTPEQASLADHAAIARFFASPLGRRVVARPERVRRELAFTMALPAREVYPDLPEGCGEEERVVVQGTIDWLVDEGDRLVLLEFKTDRPDGDWARRLEGYRQQVALYRRAVAAVYGREPEEAYLVWLAAGTALRV